MLSNIVETPPASVAIGSRVVVTFTDRPDHGVVPDFTLEQGT
jgi:hypothetical protein